MFNDDFEQAPDPYMTSSLPVRLIWGSVRFVLFGAVVIAFVFALMLVYFRWQQAGTGSRIVIEEGAEHLGSAERLVLQSYLSLNANRLSEAVGQGADVPVEFTVEVGQNANQIAIDLAQGGVLLPDNESLFLNYLRFFGLDSQLEAGTFYLSPALTVPELATVLTESSINSVTLRFLEGWRVEQMMLYIDTVQPANINSAELLGIVRRTTPFDTTPYAFLSALEPTQSLEGFLFPDSYQLPLDATATDLVSLMLDNFDQKVDPSLRQAYGTRGLTVPQAVNLAAIVEREAILAEEQPIIAGVFLNRLGQGIKLDADPTVQYVVGYWAEGDSWWKSPLSADDLQIVSPYNTYQQAGLPPAPIANPGLGALQAVADPDITDYIYFVGGCANIPPNSHVFSVTYEEHLANVGNCE